MFRAVNSTCVVPYLHLDRDHLTSRNVRISYIIYILADDDDDFYLPIFSFHEYRCLKILDRDKNSKDFCAQENTYIYIYTHRTEH